MGAIGNYEVVTQAFDHSVPPGKVALGWGVENVQVYDSTGARSTGTLYVTCAEMGC